MNLSPLSSVLTPNVISPVRPGLRYGPSPVRKRSGKHQTRLDHWFLCFQSKLSFHRVSTSDVWLSDLLEKIQALGSLPDDERLDEFARTKKTLKGTGYDSNTLDVVFAHTAHIAQKALQLRPHNSQLIAAKELLGGRFVEMATGEGKTLTMALAAGVSALDGTPVHVLTSSDYLAERDASWLDPFYRALGLSVAFVLPGMSDDERRAAYRSDVVHVTGKQVAFDWLRDSIANTGSTLRLADRLGSLTRRTHGSDELAEPLLQGLCMAIVDEADSLLVDEARTPLVLAAPIADTKTTREECVVALTLARLLHEGVDFELLPRMRLVTLTSAGEASLDELAARVDGLWKAARYRNERVREALSVLHCWHRDTDYVVRENSVELVDPHTGRALSDRRLPQTQHTLLELKERCETTPQSDVVASLPFQHFFLNYVRLAGMSGTLSEIKSELGCVYGVDVSGVEPNESSQLKILPSRVFSSNDIQLKALVTEVHDCLKQGRPVLVGTRTVEQAKRVSTELKLNHISHNVLDASQCADEASIVAGAGLAGQVTVATNMAGRGTDICLGQGVPENGGLHVISVALNDSQRLDRQLAGRAARQGDPGSFRKMLSIEDLSLIAECPGWLINGVKQLLVSSCKEWIGREVCVENNQFKCDASVKEVGMARKRNYSFTGLQIANFTAIALYKCVQRKIEKRHLTERRRSLDACENFERQVSIGGSNRLTS